MASIFNYVTFIRTSPEQLWSALTEAQFMRQYWFGMHIETDWKVGAPWKLLYADGRAADGGVIVEFSPPKRLVMTWQNEWNPEFHAEGAARLTMELEALAGAVKLSIVHEIDHVDSKLINAVSGGWPKIVSNLKSLLETGEVALKN